MLELDPSGLMKTFIHSSSREDSMCSLVLFVLQIFGLESILGSDNLWPLLLALTILPAILQSVMLPFCPESPRYLLIVLNQEEEARKGGCAHSFTTEQTWQHACPLNEAGD